MSVIPPCANQPYQPAPPNLGEPYCVDKPGNFVKAKNVFSSNLIKEVLCEDRRDREIRAHEAALTAENPRIREQLDTIGICEELKKYKHKEIVKEKRRLQLQTNSHNLRKLKLQVNAAHTKMYQTEAAGVQFQKRKHDFEERKKASAETREQLLHELEEENSTGKDITAQKAQFRCDLQEQMAYNLYKRQLEYEEKMADRNAMMATIKQYEKETQAERRRAHENKVQTNQMVEKYLLQREELKRIAREQMFEENRQLEAVQRELERRTQSNKDDKRRIWEEKMKISTAMGMHLHKINQEKLQREIQLYDLLVDERNAKEEINYKKVQEENLMLRKKKNNEFVQYHYHRKQKQLQHRLDNEKHCADRIKMLNQMKQEEEEQRALLNQKKKQFRDEIQYMASEKRQKILRQQEEELEIAKYIADMQQKDDDDIDAERLRILRNEPREVLKYMQPGALTQKEIVELGLISKAK